MNLSELEDQLVADWHHRFVKSEATLGELQDILDLHGIARPDYELDGHFAFPADPESFDADEIAEDLTPERRDEMVSGDEPSPAEIKLWQKQKAKVVFEEDGDWWHFYLWRVDVQGKHLFFRSLHGDGGILDRFDGPYASKTEALKEAAALEMSDRPPSSDPARLKES